MKRTFAPNFGKRSTPTLRRCSALVAIIGILLIAVGPAQADPIQHNRVVQTVTTSQGTIDIRLTLIGQDPVSGPKITAPTNGPGGAPGIGSSDPKLDALLSGFPIVPPSVNIGVDDISEEGEVDGTICDCGEILIAGGGFPKWPLLFLAAVPIAFIPDKETTSEPTPTPTPTPPSTPTPTPQPTPEPASLLLFGSGLVAFGAGLRHRYKKAKLANQIEKTEGEQS
ncbi:MAG TPA: PEP-CTERM sorting domain-containing protein [Pyrinomonadaceae bacterium]|nr:PEP-CTERM sorting domain-containing protein [Pyrinomonadaceae bacterium]